MLNFRIGTKLFYLSETKDPNMNRDHHPLFFINVYLQHSALSESNRIYGSHYHKDILRTCFCHDYALLVTPILGPSHRVKLFYNWLLNYLNLALCLEFNTGPPCSYWLSPIRNKNTLEVLRYNNNLLDWETICFL